MSVRPLCGLFPLLAASLCGCRYDAPPITTPLGSASCSSNKDMDGLHFAMEKLHGGLTVMFVDRLGGSSNLSTTVNDQQAVSTGKVQRPARPGYEWRLTSTNGSTGQLTINGQDYILSQGTLFVMEEQGGAIHVHQRPMDLSGTECQIPAATRFVNEHREEIYPLTGGAAAAPGTPTP